MTAIVAAIYSALCGHGIPAASPQRDAEGWDLTLICSEWRTSSAKNRAKLPTIRKTMIMRVTGKRLSRLASGPTPLPVSANMTDTPLREFKTASDHHFRLSRDTKRDQRTASQAGLSSERRLFAGMSPPCYPGVRAAGHQPPIAPHR